ncbi:MAG TPA: Hsp20/alpha crystallin family protein [Candidatus Acidoferrum sp.]|nr:Hsp20/alpha crystallin family protein [Candidatus Acidoferrum sp.]
MKPNDAAVEAYDNGEEYLFEFDLHGLTPEEVHLSLQGDALFLTGVRTAPIHAGNGLWTERPNGAFVRRLVLPHDSCARETQATIQDGVLRVHVPKKPSQDEAEQSCVMQLEESKHEHTAC